MLYFNTYMVQLKGAENITHSGVIITFQYLYGAVKSLLSLDLEC
ncbi:Uncharacterised protein [Myroides odoratimimus]|uniref:Uncharacterized protein n=1 Tax=Myroides odoratimimus CCUG 10230 TaxID=883150 RepID=A0ABP2NCL6_9FLAO|nr:hypothetical protein HMPREF9712_01572 [Myroides odoratimimus CCUG 10230]STZ49152.1 Uncharacterised protein [Myroides odoratimimus]